jgi:mono/diheme cytochrome c family protein
MKKTIALVILFAACKQTETTNETTTTMTVTESSATVATVAPTDTTPTTGTMTTIPPPVATTTTTATTATTATAAKPVPAPVPVPVPAPTTTTAPPPPPAPATAAIETMGTNPAATPPAGSDGASVFKAKGCNVCHGASGAGDTPMGKAKKIPDFRSATTQNKSDADLAKIIRDAPQHKVKALTEEQAKSVVAWIRTLK